MPRWPNRVSKQEDLYTIEKKNCASRPRCWASAGQWVETIEELGNYSSKQREYQNDFDRDLEPSAVTKFTRSPYGHCPVPKSGNRKVFPGVAPPPWKADWASGRPQSGSKHGERPPPERRPLMGQSSWRSRKITSDCCPKTWQHHLRDGLLVLWFRRSNMPNFGPLRKRNWQNDVCSMAGKAVSDAPEMAVATDL
ncbi:unnamed protein product [Cladocopium goreaui]|uniref:Uncharacterized protein n=1 Tax=Cladocopium goreaui TaxID=2562237 RepID=A0A9P1C4X3_9DINO|nr:unnamed protein product [Cladocopium goreaui]